MKELNERQRQVTRNSALKKGIDPAEVGNTRYPVILYLVEKLFKSLQFSQNNLLLQSSNVNAFKRFLTAELFSLM